jgi:WD40 repeat protein
VKLWNADSGKLEASFAKHDRGAVAAAFVSEGRVLSLGRGGDLALWTPGKEDERRETTSAGTTPSLAVSPDGKHATVLSDWRNGAKAYEIGPGGLEPRFMALTPAWAASYSARSERYAISAGREGTRVNVYRVDDGATLGDLPSTRGNDWIPLHTFLPSDDLVTASARLYLDRWTFRDRAPSLVWEKALGAGPVAVAVSLDGIALALDDGRVELRDAGSGEVVDTVDLDPAEDRPTSCAFDSSGKKLWVGTGRGALLRFAVR